jgi:hypothetical protein
VDFLGLFFFSTENFQPIKKKKNSAKKDTVATTSAGSDRVKTGNADNKKRAAIFLGCSFFGGKWSVERKEERLTGTAQRNKGSDRRETALLLVFFELKCFLRTMFFFACICKVCMYQGKACRYQDTVCMCPSSACMYQDKARICQGGICIDPTKACMYQVKTCICQGDICIYPSSICIDPNGVCMYFLRTFIY